MMKMNRIIHGDGDKDRQNHPAWICSLRIFQMLVLYLVAIDLYWLQIQIDCYKDNNAADILHGMKSEMFFMFSFLYDGPF
jgi:hypothetical protein